VSLSKLSINLEYARIFVNSRDLITIVGICNKFKRINKFTIFTGITETLQPKDYKFFAFGSSTVAFSPFSNILTSVPSYPTLG